MHHNSKHTSPVRMTVATSDTILATDVQKKKAIEAFLRITLFHKKTI